MSTARLDDDFWTDPKIEQLAPDQKLLFIWFFTNPYRNWIGLYKLPRPMIKEHTGLSDASIDRGMDRLIDMGLISYNHDFKMVFIHSMLKRQMSQSEGEEKLSKSQIKGIINQLGTLHNCPLIQNFLDKYGYLGIDYAYTPNDTPINTPNDSSLYINPQPNPQPQPNILVSKPKLKKPANGYSLDFEKLWETSPSPRRLPSKPVCYKAYLKAKSLKEYPGDDEIIKAWSYQAEKVWNYEDNEKYIPHMATWFNQSRWDIRGQPEPKHYSPIPDCPVCQGKGIQLTKKDDGRTVAKPCECVNEQIKRDSIPSEPRADNRSGTNSPGINTPGL